MNILNSIIDLVLIVYGIALLFLSAIGLLGFCFGLFDWICNRLEVIYKRIVCLK